jgi:hypothetical protein
MRPRDKADKDRCPIGFTEAMELWLGPNPGGSAFRSREELVGAWQCAREYVMRMWGCGGRRPAAFYAFEWDGSRPAYAVERSTLWRANKLSPGEKEGLETEWKMEFERAQAPDFTLSEGGGELLRGDHARAEHYRHHDIPRELVKRWSAAARRRRSRMVSEKSPGVASGAEGKEESHAGGSSLAQPVDH